MAGRGNSGAAKKRVRKSEPPETALYQPVRDFLVAGGFTVRGEVCHCDISAVRGEELVVVELKRNFNVDLLLQATLRQKLTDSVYVGLPESVIKVGPRKWRKMLHLLRRLELGLILVNEQARVHRVKVILDPGPLVRRKQHQKRRALLSELIARSGDYNVGGSTRTKLVTAYRESAIGIACALELFGPLSPRKLRALGTGQKTLSILGKNFYGWFERVKTGLYALSERGRAELHDYPELAERLRRELRQRQGE